MKTKIFRNSIAVIVPLSIVLIFNMCNKDNDASDADYRVVKWDYLSGQQIAGTDTVIYSGDKVKTILEHDPSWGYDSTKTEVNYPDENSAVLINYLYENGEWFEDSKQELTLQNGKVIQSVDYFYYSGRSYEPWLKITYQYSGNNMTEKIAYSYENENWVETAKVTHQYNGNDLTLTKVYYFETDGWKEDQKAEISYIDGKIDGRIEYSFAEGVYQEEYKYEFNYTNGHLGSIDYYSYDNGEWNPEGVYMSFVYTRFDRVAMWTDVSEDHSQIHFFYSKGKGNIRQIFFQGEEYFDNIVPMPTKSFNGRSGMSRRHFSAFFPE
jgi:hypothetical protein